MEWGLQSKQLTIVGVGGGALFCATVLESIKKKITWKTLENESEYFY